MARLPKTNHVVIDINGAWVVRKTGSARISKRFATKDAAESWGRTQSIKERADLVIHRTDGTVAQKTSYANETLQAAGHKK
jgi:pterin-4a-carbinolamine dehydratase